MLAKSDIKHRNKGHKKTDLKKEEDKNMNKKKDKAEKNREAHLENLGTSQLSTSFSLSSS